MSVSFEHPPMHRTLGIIMGGGAGTRLFPLTKERSKPAVPLGGKYRLVDIPISNCINSGIRGIFVLTQFNTTSLHHHIHASYRFDIFSKGFIEILAAQQTPEGATWYQGTADAVRQNLRYFLERPYDYFLILSGDQLYRMDYKDVLRQHIRNNADITLATIPVNRETARGFGIMQTDESRRIRRFVEKPQEDELLDALRIPPVLLAELGRSESEDLYQASMGIYVFNRDILVECLKNNFVDFGKNVIPAAIDRFNVHAYIHQGYWEDIGTIRAFFDANLNLADPNPQYSFYQPDGTIYTQSRFLPASIIRATTVDRSIISDGCLISGATIDRCIIGIRTVIQAGTRLKNTIIMGADYYENEAGSPEKPPVGIGKDCVIEQAIIDKNARIGNRVVITPQGKAPDAEGRGYYIRDGIVVVPKGAILPDGTWI